eukprot:SAG31_NODE_12235_length_957_cov_0.668998_1_plen_270_part_01
MGCSLTLLLLIPAALHQLVALPPLSSGSERFLPNELAGAGFKTLGSPAVTDGGLLRLKSIDIVGSSPSPSGFVSSGPGHSGDVVLDLHISSIALLGKAYEAIPYALLVSPSYNQSTNAGPRAQQGLKLHATINDTWMDLAVYSNASDAPSAQLSWQTAPAYSEAVTVRLIRRGPFSWGGLLRPHPAGATWWGAGTNYGSSSPPGHIRWIAAPAGRLQFGMRVDPDYAAAYQIDVSCLDIWVDADMDGLSDLEETSIVTKPTYADSDRDRL